MAKKIILDNEAEIIADTMICDIRFSDEIISSICKYCGTPIEIHKEEHYDYHDRESWTTKTPYCPKQCDGVQAEYEEQEEIAEAIKLIKSRYYDRRKNTYSNSKVYFNATQKYIDEINERHKNEIKLLNNKVSNILEKEIEGSYIKVRKGE